MKQVSQEQFEEYIRLLIDGKTTKTKIAKILETSVKKVNYMIDDLATSNKELYMELLEKNPYVPRDTNIDPAALAKEVIKYGRTNVAEDLGISLRTISRTVAHLKTTNPKLYELYRSRIKRKRTMSEAIAYKEAVDEEAAKLGFDINPERESVEERLEYVSKILSKFEELVDSGMTHRDAAKKLGYASNATIWMMYQDKRKMELTLKMQREQKAKKDEAKEYRESMKIQLQDQGKKESLVSGRIDDSKDRNNRNQKGRDD